MTHPTPKDPEGSASKSECCRWCIESLSDSFCVLPTCKCHSTPPAAEEKCAECQFDQPGKYGHSQGCSKYVKDRCKNCAKDCKGFCFCDCHPVPDVPEESGESLEEEWYRKVEPFVEEMKSRYPKEMNMDGLDPALTDDIAEIVGKFVSLARQEHDRELVRELAGMNKFRKRSLWEDERDYVNKKKGYIWAIEEIIANHKQN